MRAYSRYAKRGFTLVELMIVVAIIGILAALAIYGVSRFLSSSKTAEAKNTVGAISRAAQSAWERQIAESKILAEGDSISAGASNLCETAQSVPQGLAAVQGKKYQPITADGSDFETGSDKAGWKCLRFRMSDPIQYQYLYTKAGSPVSGQVSSPDSFEAGALGDTDGDNTTAKFALTGEINPQTKQLKRSTTIFIADESE
jgi:type IV pilus assembly protein PilA